MDTAPARRTFHGPLLTGGRALPPSRVTVEAGRIAAIDPALEPSDEDVVVHEGWIVPGLIDVQVNGAGGVDLTAADDPEDAVARVARTLAEHGVTAFCPTIVSSQPDPILERLSALRPRPLDGGAESLGAHVEGPFISPEKRGVHDPANLRHATTAEIDRWLAEYPPAIVTLAPELSGALAAIHQLTRAGVVVSLGHSSADLAAARAGLAAGATLGTHLFNAMPPLHHRAPGLVGALLAGTARIGIIADGLHVDPVALDVVVRAAGPGRVVLVSDALAAAGLPPGPTVLGDQEVVSDGEVVKRADGTIAGSAVLLETGLRRVREWLPWLAPAEVVRMATQTPAEALGPAIAARKGRVAPGYDADLAILDADWRVRTVVVRGEVITPAANRVS